MRRLALAVLFCSIFLPLLNAQTADPARAVNQARMSDYNEHMRGKMIPMKETNGVEAPQGKMLNIREIALKTKEMNELMHLVSLDVVNLNKGILSADLSEKLKKIEKLSRELRKSVE